MFDQQRQHRFQLAFHLRRQIRARFQKILEIGRAPDQVFATAFAAETVREQQMIVLLWLRKQQPALVVVRIRLAATARVDGTGDAEAIEFMVRFLSRGGWGRKGSARRACTPLPKVCFAPYRMAGPRAGASG